MMSLPTATPNTSLVRDSPKPPAVWVSESVGTHCLTASWCAGHLGSGVGSLRLEGEAWAEGEATRELGRPRCQPDPERPRAPFGLQVLTGPRTQPTPCTLISQVFTSLPSPRPGPCEQPDLQSASWPPPGGVRGPLHLPCVVTMPTLTCGQVHGQTFAAPDAQGRQELAMGTSHVQVQSAPLGPLDPDTHLQHTCLMTHFGHLSLALALCPRDTILALAPRLQSYAQEALLLSSLPKGLTAWAYFLRASPLEKRA